MLRARNYRSIIRRCPLINCSYRNFRLDDLKKHLRLNRHKINNEDVVNRILEMVGSNSLPEETLLRVQNDNIVQVTVGSQLEKTASTIQTAMQSEQGQNASGSEVLSTATQNLRNDGDDGDLLCDQRQPSESLPPRLPHERVRTPPGDANSLPEAVASLHAAIQKIKINERDMKTVLEQTKSVLESKISEIDQRLQKTDTITTNVDNTTRPLAQLQATYSWLQVKPPSVPLGACSLCQRHSLQIRQHRGYSSIQNWLNCSVALDCNHRAQKVKLHKQSECHKICMSTEEQRKKNAIFSSSQINKKKEEEITERFLLRCYGLIQWHVPYNRYPFITYLHHLQGVEVGNRHLTGMAMASATDCIYDVQLRSLVKFINSSNPSTGRLRHCHLSFDKVTVEHVTRQVVNLRLLDLNGEPVCINGNQSVISRHEDPVPDYTISLGDILWETIRVMQEVCSATSTTFYASN